MNVGDELFKARKAAGLTQEELAFKANVSRNYISLLERNEKSPTVQMLLRLCKSLGIRASTIVARIERS